MNELLTQYYAALVESIEAERAGKIEQEDALLARLDHLWLQMGPRERDRTDELNLAVMARPPQRVRVTIGTRRSVRQDHISAVSDAVAGALGIFFVSGGWQPQRNVGMSVTKMWAEANV